MVQVALLFQFDLQPAGQETRFTGHAVDDFKGSRFLRGGWQEEQENSAQLRGKLFF